MALDNSGADKITAQITNLSGSTVYIQDCRAREIKNKKRILTEQRRAELSRFIMDRNAKFDCRSYSMLGDEPLKIENCETVRLHHKINFAHPLAGFFNEEFAIVVTLTNGKIITSRRFMVPVKWMHPIWKKYQQ